MRAIVWGTGRIANDYYLKKAIYRDFEIIAFSDNNSILWNTDFNGITVVPPGDILKLDFDVVLIWCSHAEEVITQLTNELHVSKEQIYTYRDLDKRLCEALIEEYKDSTDEQIKKVLNYYQEKGFNIYGYYDKKLVLPYLVERDNDGWPYIIFEGKKMFYPKQYDFPMLNGRECIYDVLYEQGNGSPHKYVREQTEIQDGSIIVDAGVCEGNFALRYIDRAKKIYLIESELKWMEALKRTFKDYEDKVVFCQKYLTRYDSQDTITLDTLIEEEIDFLKMDIEGAEIDALLGGKKVLQRSNAKCAICSYHKQNDADNIGWIMRNMGYRVSESEGYMFFIYDDNIADSMDFRKGLIYADKI